MSTRPRWPAALGAPTETPLPDVDVAAVEAAIGPLSDYHHRCGAASIALVESGLYPGARVARGFVPGVRSQHSWVCLGEPYRPQTPVIDLVLWSYVDEPHQPWIFSRSGGAAWVGRVRDRPHHPHGWGVLWPRDWPTHRGGHTVALTPSAALSGTAEMFLDSLGPLDHRGWMQLANGPMGGWPAAEIIPAMCDTDALRALVPIDIVGMLTDRNPSGCYPRTPGSPS